MTAGAGAEGGVLTVGALCAGIGGIELGLEMTGGFRTLWQAEKDEFARRVLAKHWPDALRLEDVRDVHGQSVPRVDLITAGLPCQPHSLAGKRESSNDQRDLWGEFARIVGDLEPRFLLVENVPGILSSTDPAFGRDYPGAYFGRILSDLAALGYDAEWECLPASAFGCYHERERLFLLAYPAGQHGDARGGVVQGRDWRASLESRRLHGRAVATRGQAPHARLESEPALDRMVYDVPYRVVRDELGRLGNAVVPQVARWIGEQILRVA